MDKKLVIWVCGISIVFPVIINILMFFNIFPVKGEINTWISTLGTFWGAIIGGVISGVLTLRGVKISIEASFKGIEKSIQHQENERYKETIGIKLNNLYRVKKIIYTLDRMLSNRTYGWNENFEEDEPKKIEKAIGAYILPKHNELLEISSSVDWDFYEEIKVFVEKSRKIFTSPEPPDYDELFITTDKLTEDIEYIHEKRLIEKFKAASN